MQQRYLKRPNRARVERCTNSYKPYWKRAMYVSLWGTGRFYFSSRLQIYLRSKITKSVWKSVFWILIRDQLNTKSIWNQAEKRISKEKAWKIFFTFVKDGFLILPDPLERLGVELTFWEQIYWKKVELWVFHFRFGAIFESWAVFRLGVNIFWHSLLRKR